MNSNPGHIKMIPISNLTLYESEQRVIAAVYDLADGMKNNIGQEAYNFLEVALSLAVADMVDKRERLNNERN